MSKANNHKMVRLPLEVANRLERLAAEMLASYEEGKTTKIGLTEQGAKGVWVPLHAVITKALDELEGHKARSKKSGKKAKVAPAVEAPVVEDKVA